jgi:hypothetical protein
MFVIAENMMLTFMICHMIGVSSACTNPILYGFLNNNFVKEFNRILPFASKMFKSRKKLDQLQLKSYCFFGVCRVRLHPV